MCLVPPFGLPAANQGCNSTSGLLSLPEDILGLILQQLDDYTTVSLLGVCSDLTKAILAQPKTPRLLANQTQWNSRKALHPLMAWTSAITVLGPTTFTSEIVHKHRNIVDVKLVAMALSSLVDPVLINTFQNLQRLELSCCKLNGTQQQVDNRCTLPMSYHHHLSYVPCHSLQTLILRSVDCSSWMHDVGQQQQQQQQPGASCSHWLLELLPNLTSLSVMDGCNAPAQLFTAWQDQLTSLTVSNATKDTFKQLLPLLPGFVRLQHLHLATKDPCVMLLDGLCWLPCMPHLHTLVVPDLVVAGTHMALLLDMPKLRQVCIQGFHLEGSYHDFSSRHCAWTQLAVTGGRWQMNTLAAFPFKSLTACPQLHSRTALVQIPECDSTLISKGVNNLGLSVSRGAWLSQDMDVVVVGAGCKVDTELAAVLKMFLPALQPTRGFGLSFVNIGHATLSAVSSFYASSLTRLVLHQCCWDYRSTGLWSAMLQGLPQLREVDFYWGVTAYTESPFSFDIPEVLEMTCAASLPWTRHRLTKPLMICLMPAPVACDCLEPVLDATLHPAIHVTLWQGERFVCEELGSERDCLALILSRNPNPYGDLSRITICDDCSIPFN